MPACAWLNYPIPLTLGRTAWHVLKARGPLRWRTNRTANLLDALVYVLSCAHRPTPWGAAALALYIPMRALSWVW